MEFVTPRAKIALSVSVALCTIVLPAMAGAWTMGTSTKTSEDIILLRDAEGQAVAPSFISWNDAKLLLARCKVQKMEEVPAGVLRLTLLDGSHRSVSAFDSVELAAHVQDADDRCAFQMTLDL